MAEDRESQGVGSGDARRTHDQMASLGGTLDGTLIDRIGIHILEPEPDRVVARMPVDGNRQPFGLLHGGATGALCETVGSLGASLGAAPDRTAVGIELNVNHLLAVTRGHVTAIGTPLHSGRSVAVWDVRVQDDDGRLIAVGRLTLAVREIR